MTGAQNICFLLTSNFYRLSGTLRQPTSFMWPSYFLLGFFPENKRFIKSSSCCLRCLRAIFQSFATITNISHKLLNRNSPIQPPAYQPCLPPTLVLLHGRPPALNVVTLQDCALFVVLLVELLCSLLLHSPGIFALAAASRLRLIAWPPGLRVLLPHRLMAASIRLVPPRSLRV